MTNTPRNRSGPPHRAGATPPTINQTHQHQTRQDQATGCSHCMPTTPPRRGDTVGELLRRRMASWRCEPLASGHRDPIQPWRPEHVSDLQVAGYRAAVQHLRAHGLLAAPNIPAMQELWRLGGEDRRLVSELAEAWELAA